MSGLLSCVGFPVENEEGFLALLEQSALNGQKVASARGSYYFWDVGEGVEIWVQENESGELVGLNPFFNGQNRVSVLVQRALSLGQSGDMDGAYLGSVGFQDAVDQDREFEIFFEAPDVLGCNRGAFPGLFPVRLSAFIYAMEVFESERDFRNVVGVEDASPGNFLAHGLYADDGEYARDPDAHALFSGVVLECGERTNPETGVQFQWAVVQTEEMKIEVVGTDADIVGELKPERIVQGSFWLTGRLLGD